MRNADIKPLSDSDQRHLLAAAGLVRTWAIGLNFEKIKVSRRTGIPFLIALTDKPRVVFKANSYANGKIVIQHH